MRTEPAFVGAMCVDSLPFSVGGTAAQAKALRSAGVDAVYGYLGVISAQRVRLILDAGMAFMPVTLAAHYDGLASIAQCRSLGVTPGVTVCLDVEGMTAFRSDPIALAKTIDAWADPVDAAGFMPGGYFGSPQPFTSEEMWALHVKRYWRGQGRIVDRHNALAEPTKSGWCVTQIYPSVQRGGVLVDVDVVGQDYLGRVPSWMIGT
jgi:hypothetical protein